MRASLLRQCPCIHQLCIPTVAHYVDIHTRAQVTYALVKNNIRKKEAGDDYYSKLNRAHRTTTTVHRRRLMPGQVYQAVYMGFAKHRIRECKRTRATQNLLHEQF